LQEIKSAYISPNIVTLDEYLTKEYANLKASAARLVKNDRQRSLDILHEAIEKLLIQPAETKDRLLKQGKVSHYILRSCWHGLLSEGRAISRHKTTNKLPDIADITTAYSIDEEIVEAGIHLADLTPVDRKILCLHLFEGYTVKEISRGSQVSERYIYSSLRRSKIEIAKIVVDK